MEGGVRNKIVTYNKIVHNVDSPFKAVGKSRGHSIRRIGYIRNLEIHNESVDKKSLLDSNLIERAGSGNQEGTVSETKAETGMKEEKRSSGSKKLHRNKKKHLNSEAELGCTKVTFRRVRNRKRKKNKEKD